MANDLQPAPVSWRSRSKTAVTSLLKVLFPPICASCRKVGSILCTECRENLQWIEEPICQYCGRTTRGNIPICPFCLQRPLPLKQIRAAVIFAEPVSTVIHKMKYEGMFGLAEPLADLMAKAWEKWKVSTDIIIPIPLHPDREKKRGYNQSTLLANRLGACLRMNVEPDALQRTRFTTPQVELNALERATNVAGAFAVYSPSVAGKDILLVDDVCTTGATMVAAAQALLEAKVTSVSGYCVARAM